MPETLTILDDYQGVALESADWSAVRDHYDIDVVTEHLEGDELIERLRSSVVVVAMRERTALSRETLEQLPQLRLLVTTGMANAAIDVEAAKAQGIVVSGTGGSGREVAELTIGMMIALARNIVAEDTALHADGWQHTIGTRLEGKTLGLLGFGKQARWVAELATAFRMTIIAWSPTLTDERASEGGASVVTFEKLFTDSDFLSVHVPLTEETRGLVSADQLAEMKETAFLINTSRGPIVDAEALMMALMVDTLQGAALDVFDIEPLPLKDPLRKLSNVLLLPHLGYVTREVYEVFYSEAVDDVLAFVAGSPIRTLS
ncbi:MULTISPECIES: D-2-hydroxyacid dehydrogenase family protein [unclassified Frondihabitans]|uniref:D-2-hydroxyacid dehydrogenase family protein n=1 Tax=unclassified Frondihabitans TaxID=2626248 RepID=UPI000F4D5B17|nr:MULTISPECIES: D-2-hydroxyacid dehydrogenase family protein [unclassified Frondihabitans]RPE78727.1 phosphoglycerate dehydrogenase-like enzyme [Frondihabitans sp. PhB153]RPF09008.1 phosphoglycerate dehydrogenase-like enzyme [Frondihabitans sp. PhB161]